jgi:hypothetical protein
MKPVKLVLYAAGALAVLVALTTLSAPKLRAAIRATLVEVVIPAKPYYGGTTLSNAVVAFGPDTGTLAVSNITLTNNESNVQQVFLFSPGLFVPCESGSIANSHFLFPQMGLYVQPHSTLVLTYPTPLVFTGTNGHTCIAAQVTTPLHGEGVEIDVTGFVD